MLMSPLKLLSQFGQMEMTEFNCVKWKMVLMET